MRRKCRRHHHLNVSKMQQAQYVWVQTHGPPPTRPCLAQQMAWHHCLPVETPNSEITRRPWPLSICHLAYSIRPPILSVSAPQIVFHCPLFSISMASPQVRIPIPGLDRSLLHSHPKPACRSVKKLRGSTSSNSRLAHLISLQNENKKGDRVLVLRGQKEMGNGMNWKRSLLNDYKFWLWLYALRKLIIVICLINIAPFSRKGLINGFW